MGDRRDELALQALNGVPLPGVAQGPDAHRAPLHLGNGGAHLDRHARAVFHRDLGLAAPGPLAQEARKLGRHRAIAQRADVHDRSGAQLVERAAQQLDGGQVSVEDVSVGVADQDRIGYALEDRPIACLVSVQRFLRAPSLGQLAARAAGGPVAHQPRFAGRQNRVAEGLH